MNFISNAPKILVIGDLMIDHYIYGNCTRISPEAPVPVVEITDEKFMLGGAGNVLKNLRSFNCEASIYSVVGDDKDALVLLNSLTECGVSTEGIIKDSSRCTSIKSRVLAINHQLIRLDRENVNPVNATEEDKLISLLETNIGMYDIVLLSDYNKGLLTNRLLKEIFRICRSADIKTVLDPKGLDFTKYKGVNVIKPNKKEASLATGIAINNEESLRKACVKIKELTQCDDVIITLSEDGIAIYSNDIVNMIPTKALDVVDVTGAGDTVLASLGLALAAKKTLQEACKFANHAAAIVVSKVGSATTTIEEINEKFK